MAFTILDNCINCGRCPKYCPVEAITPGDDIFEIDPDICVECIGYHDTQQCAVVCPVEACVTLVKTSI